MLQNADEIGVVAHAAKQIADQQVRNRGTIGGSIAHGDPASDLPTVLLAMDGEVTVQGLGRRAPIAAADLFQDYLTTAVGPDEVLTAVHLPSIDGYGWGYEKFTRRAEDWAMVGVVALVKANGGTVRGRPRRVHPHGHDPAAGDRGRGGAARAVAERREHRGGGRAGRRGHRTRPATSTPRPSTSSISRGC